MAEPILRLAFTCREWMRSNAQALRIKIENGILYVKPVVASATGSDLVRFTILATPRSGSYHTVLTPSQALTRRIITLLTNIGWDGQSRMFRLLPAQRGWYSIFGVNGRLSKQAGYVTAYLTDAREAEWIMKHINPKVITPEDVRYLLRMD